MSDHGKVISTTPLTCFCVEPFVKTYRFLRSLISISFTKSPSSFSFFISSVPCTPGRKDAAILAAMAAALAAASEAVSLAAEEPTGGAGEELEGASAHRERLSASILTADVECRCKWVRERDEDGRNCDRSCFFGGVRFGGTGSNYKSGDWDTRLVSSSVPARTRCSVRVRGTVIMSFAFTNEIMVGSDLESGIRAFCHNSLFSFTPQPLYSLPFFSFSYIFPMQLSQLHRTPLIAIYPSLTHFRLMTPYKHNI